MYRLQSARLVENLAGKTADVSRETNAQGSYRCQPHFPEAVDTLTAQTK